jgi:hypothetical protein
MSFAAAGSEIGPYPENLTSESAREIFALWSRSGSGSAGELDLNGLKQDVGRLPHFVSDAGYRFIIRLVLVVVHGCEGPQPSRSGITFNPNSDFRNLGLT